MKRIGSLSVIILILLPLATSAQEPQGSVFKPKTLLRWGVQAGWNINGPGSFGAITQHFTVTCGYNLGAALNITRNTNGGWFVEPAVKIGYDKFKFTPAVAENGMIGIDRWSVNVPVKFGEKRVMSNGLIESSSYLMLDMNYFFGNHTTRLPEGYTSGNLWNPVSVSWGLGTGIRCFNSRFDIMLLFGFNNLQKSGRTAIAYPNAKNNRLVITYTCFFGSWRNKFHK